MTAEFSTLTKVLDGHVSLRISDIQTITVDGGSIPAGMDVDSRAGTVAWADQNNLGDPGPYLFEGTHRTPDETFSREAPKADKEAAQLRQQITPERFIAAYLDEQAGNSTAMDAIKAIWTGIKA